MFYSLNNQAAWRPMRELQRFHREVDRLLGSARAHEPPGFPVNVSVKEDLVEVTAELPGLGRDQIELSVEGRELVLRIQAEPVAYKGYSLLTRGTPVRSVTRTLELPVAVETGGIEASYREGVLHLVLPAVEAERKRTIPVNEAE